MSLTSNKDTKELVMQYFAYKLALDFLDECDQAGITTLEGLELIKERGEYLRQEPPAEVDTVFSEYGNYGENNPPVS